MALCVQRLMIHKGYAYRINNHALLCSSSLRKSSHPPSSLLVFHNPITGCEDDNSSYKLRVSVSLVLSPASMNMVLHRPFKSYRLMLSSAFLRFFNQMPYWVMLNSVPLWFFSQMPCWCDVMQCSSAVF